MSGTKYDAMKDEEPGVSLFATVINTVKGIMGAGILTLSWAFYFSSLYPGLVCTFFMCALSMYGFYLIGLVSDKTGADTFGGMWSKLYGSGMAWVPDMVIVLFSSACIIGYLIVCKGYIPQGLAVFGIAKMPGYVYVLGSTAIVLYFNYQSDLSVLTPTSMIGNFSIFYTTFLLLAFWFATPVSDYSDWDGMVLEPGLFVTLPTMAFSFNGHFGAPGMYQQLAGKSPAKWLKVTILGFGGCLPLVLICALSGFFMFDSENLVAQSNVLLQKEMTGKYSVAVAFVGMSFAVLFGVPIHTNAVRGALNGIIMRAKGIDPSNDPGAGSRFFMITTTLTILTNLVALSLDDLGLVVSLNGAVTATMMMYILPALMYMKFAGKSVGPMITLILGVIIGITGVTTGLMVGMGEGSELRW